MKKNQVLTACLIGITASLAINARADDFAPPPWVRGDPRTTATEWEFATDAHIHTPPDGNTVPTIEGEFGTPDVSIYADPADDDPVWSNGDGDGQWASGADPIFMGFQIGNWEDTEPVKYLRIQVTYGGQAPSVSSINALHQTAPTVTIVPTGTTSFGAGQILFEYEIYPNPFFEIFDLEIPANSSVDQVVIDTISIPEPSTLVLAALGLLSLLGLRRGDRHSFENPTHIKEID